MQQFTDILFNDNEVLWDEYLEHPFVKGLGDGTLEIEKFKYYMIQDYIYLKNYIKVFAIALTKSDTEEDLRLFSDAISNTLREIDMVHKPYMTKIGISQHDIDTTKVSLKNLSYTHYMLAKAYSGDLLDALVLILSCSWSYGYIAKELLQKNSSCLNHEFYGEWVAGYIDQEYDAANAKLIQKVNLLAKDISPTRQKELRDIFTNCSIYEKEFWDMSYNLN